MTKDKKLERRYHESEQLLTELTKLKMRLEAINALSEKVTEDIEKLRKDLVDELFTTK